MRILIIAYACEPNRGSEAGTAWHLSRELAKMHEVWVATRANNREPVEYATRTSFEAYGPRFHFIDPPDWAVFLKRKKVISAQLFYLLWQVAVKKHLRKGGIEYDLIHQLTFNSFEVPPLQFSDTSAVKVWGPIGGGQTTPISMLRAFPLKAKIYEAIRSIRIWISEKNPLVRSTLRSCHKVIIANSETHVLLQPHIRSNPLRMIDVGVDTSKFSPIHKIKRSEEITFISAGALIPRKGTKLLIEAFIMLHQKHSGVRLVVIGEGPERKRIEALIKKHQIHGAVTLIGQVDHEQMSNRMNDADVFVFPSLRDTSGAVVLEAMSKALPVICFDHQGAADMVNRGSGMRVPVAGFRQTLDNLTDAMHLMAINPSLRKQYGIQARKTAQKFDWHYKAKVISDLYKSMQQQIQPPS